MHRFIEDTPTPVLLADLTAGKDFLRDGGQRLPCGDQDACVDHLDAIEEELERRSLSI